MEPLVIHWKPFYRSNKYHVQCLADCLVCIDGAGWVDRVLVPEAKDYDQVLTDARQHHQRELQAGEYLLRVFTTYMCTTMAKQDSLDRPLADWLAVPFPQGTVCDRSFAGKCAAILLRGVALQPTGRLRR